MELIDLLLDDDSKKFSPITSPSSPIETMDGDRGGDGDTFRARSSEDGKIVTCGSVFPHCPHCLSYYLYRRNNRGNYQCESCGLADISETAARRTQ